VISNSQDTIKWRLEQIIIILMCFPCCTQEIATLKAELQLAKAQASKQGRLLRVKEEEARVSNEVRPSNQVVYDNISNSA